MAAIAKLKKDRVHLRLDAASKRKLERAAAYEETTVSRFVLANAVAAAERFQDARLDPPEPNAMLREAARRYRARFCE